MLNHGPPDPASGSAGGRFMPDADIFRIDTGDANHRTTILASPPRADSGPVRPARDQGPMEPTIMATVSDRARPGPPHPLLTWTEGHRLLVEAAAFAALGPLLRRLPQGDGHPVWVLPGFMASDASTLPLRRLLRRRGYNAHAWGFGRNLGPRGDLTDRMIDWLRTLHRDTGRTVSLVGQSLGGIYARELARMAPECVRQVITLGSPFGSVDGGGTHPGVSRLFEVMVDRRVDMLQEEHFFARIDEPVGVPTTAVFSKLDGIAHWRTCIEREHPLTDNVEVHGSHCGMAINPQVLYVIGDRLAQPDGAWRRFDRSGLRGLVFPDGRVVAAPAPMQTPLPTAMQAPTLA